MVDQTKVSERKLNVFTTSLILLLGYFICVGLLGAVLSIFGIPLHPLGLLLVWTLMAAAVARRVARLHPVPPQTFLCVLTLVLAVAIYAMIAAAVAFRLGIEDHASAFLQMIFLSVLMVIFGMLSFSAVFRYAYRQ